MSVKRKNMPGYVKSKNINGRIYWKKKPSKKTSKNLRPPTLNKELENITWKQVSQYPMLETFFVKWINKMKVQEKEIHLDGSDSLLEVVFKLLETEYDKAEPKVHERIKNDFTKASIKQLNLKLVQLSGSPKRQKIFWEMRDDRTPEPNLEEIQAVLKENNDGSYTVIDGNHRTMKIMVENIDNAHFLILSKT